MIDIYKDFLRTYDYDVRKSHNARWIDQKCTYDVISIVADCIVDYVSKRTDLYDGAFTINDIWHSEYSINNVISIFSKPSPEEKTAKSEYDKYFSQPINLLCYSGILSRECRGRQYYYRVEEMQLLKKIALREQEALFFLCEYIEKVLSDSGLFQYFYQFIARPTVENYLIVREEFIKYTIDNTNINRAVECGRIFTKILNPLAYKYGTLGTEKGRLSSNVITKEDISYNRKNWRDKYSRKDKTITRNQHFAFQDPSSEYEISKVKYNIAKSKKYLKEYNATNRNNRSEVYQLGECSIEATQVHHIFPQSYFKGIADYLENLIVLTANQHFTMAHPSNKTSYVDKDFQYICLLAKNCRILEAADSNLLDNIYDFNRFMYVLNLGLSTDVFSKINYGSYIDVQYHITAMYNRSTAWRTHPNKYADLIDGNSLRL